MKPAIIVHGGAKTISEDKVAANQAGCRAAVEAGWSILCSGGSAAEAVEAAIRVLEADQTFNAGFGSTLNSEGEVEDDAAMMEGETLGWGAIAAVQGVRHPISVARRIMEDKPRLLVADGGERFASEHGLERCAKADLVSRERESIMPVVLAKSAIDTLASGAHPEAAAQQAIDTMIERVEGEAGCIVIDREGRMGWAHNSSDMAVACMSTEMAQPACFTRQDQKLTPA